MANAAQRNPRKHPGDMTGKRQESAKRDAAEELEAIGEQMAMTQSVKSARAKGLVDYTDAARPKPALITDVVEPDVPREHIIRVVADIEDMVYGREVIDAGDFSDPDHVKLPVLGGLKHYDFKEGTPYKVDHDMYLHLQRLEYIYE